MSPHSIRHNCSRMPSGRHLDKKALIWRSMLERPPSTVQHRCSKYHRRSCTLRDNVGRDDEATMKQEVDGDIIPVFKARQDHFLQSTSTSSLKTHLKECEIDGTGACDVIRPLSHGSQDQPKPTKKAVHSSAKKTKWSQQASYSQPQQEFGQFINGDGASKGDRRIDSGEPSDGDESDGRCSIDTIDPRAQKGLLACPFYKYDSMRYMSCVRLRLTRVRDVKQHLNRRHCRPIHCPICGDIFPDRQVWEMHIQERTCVRPPDGFFMEGITEEQSLALRRRVNRGLDEASQWFSVWRILFPGSPLPHSPYLRNNFEETLCMVHDYWRNHGHELVAELAGSGPASAPDGHYLDSRVAALSSNVIETLLLRFRIRSQAVMDPNSSNLTNIETTSRGVVTSGSNTIDSCPIERPPALQPFHEQPQTVPQHDATTSTGDMDANPEKSNNANTFLALLDTSKPTSPTVADTTMSIGISGQSNSSLCSSPYNQGDFSINSVLPGNIIDFGPPSWLLTEDLSATAGHLNSQELAFLEMGTWDNVEVNTSVDIGFNSEEHPLLVEPMMDISYPWDMAFNSPLRLDDHDVPNML